MLLLVIVFRELSADGMLWDELVSLEELDRFCISASSSFSSSVKVWKLLVCSILYWSL